MDSELICNYKMCRKPLSTGMAWTTSCSHIFCNEDGENILGKIFYFTITDVLIDAVYYENIDFLSLVSER